MTIDDLAIIKKVHFIGIGGVGISAIARMFQLEGKEVGGSDQSEGEVVKELHRLGVKIAIGHQTENLEPDTDLVIYTIAIPADNPELVAAKTAGIPVLTYPEALGLISSGKYTIAVAGTHGKTTTTGMLAKIFLAAKLDPTVVIGSFLPELKTNFIAGRSKPARTTDAVQSGGYFITEACEYRRSFLNLQPQILVVTNIDNDHLDYYKDMADIQNAFTELASKVPIDGFLVCDSSDPLLAPIIAAAKCQVVNYRDSAKPEKFNLQVPGEHNLKDAQAALAAALSAGVEENVALEALAHFTGTWRRFEYKGKMVSGALVYDDYGHHPTEIKATLAGAREKFPDKKIIAIFQPHLYSRTKLLFNDFAAAFTDAEQTVVAPIFAAREADDGTIKAEDLAMAIEHNSSRHGGTGRPAKYFPDFTAIAQYVNKIADANSLILTIGAGDIYKVGEALVAQTI